MPLQTIRWTGESVRIIDQTRLPSELIYLDCRDVETMAEAIESLRIRGAPAIGIAAAYGVVLGIQDARSQSWEAFEKALDTTIDRLARTRPTAVNLFWALDRMRRKAQESRSQGGEGAQSLLLEEAHRILEEDRSTCRTRGKNGAALLTDGMTVLTHCNAGGLATADFGTALGVIYAAQAAGKTIKVFADETRPLLQGARLTAWELMQNQIAVTLICDNMAACVMQQGKVDAVLVGADRIASNGDVANKIGTYGLAVLAQAHQIPFYVAAPISTLDVSLKSGDQIPIEERKPEEVTCGFGRRTGPEGIAVYNPAFDVTPHRLVSAIISEKGIAREPYGEVLKEWAEE
ncbi:MAG: S-methyl-5-thioribose-1-phosphate isomerase [Candidatus Latescibacterota bacterium]